MNVNKVIFFGRTLFDLATDTVTAETLLEGYTAHDKSGTQITGSYVPKPYKQELEYIESTGTQYIDTNFYPNQDTRLDIVTMPTSIAEAGTGDGGFISYGASRSYNQNSFECYLSKSQFEFNYDGQYGFAGTPVLNTKVTISHNKNIISVRQDGNTDTLTFTYNAFASPYTLTLFAINRGSAIRGLQRLYSCQIYDNSTLIRDFIPVLDWSNVPCLYDKVNEELYYNAGTGSFTYG